MSRLCTHEENKEIVNIARKQWLCFSVKNVQKTWSKVYWRNLCWRQWSWILLLPVSHCPSFCGLHTLRPSPPLSPPVGPIKSDRETLRSGVVFFFFFCWVCFESEAENTQRSHHLETPSVWPWVDARTPGCVCIINAGADESFVGQAVWRRGLAALYSLFIFFFFLPHAHKFTLRSVSSVCPGRLPLQCVHSERTHVCSAGCGQVHAGQSADQPGAYHWR